MTRPLDDAIDTLTRFASDHANADRIGRIADLLARSIRAGGKAMACGNGGSACDAMHFCEELTGRFHRDRPPLPAICCNDPGHITCTANDFGYEHVFSRWVEALGRPGDVLFLLSTSGRSANVIAAAETARRLGITTIGLLGRDGGPLLSLCDDAWVVSAERSDRIQEVHMVVLHAVVEGVENHLFSPA